MSLLEHPEAQALLADAEVSTAAVRGCRQRLQQFLRRYLPKFYREEQRELAEVVLHGKLSHLQRKTSEPIAYQAGRQRKPVQNFVGAGAWDDEAVMSELRRHVAQERGHEEGVAVLDGSGFPKSGKQSCGVARQWCGRLGKVENCQVGVFLSYVSERGVAPLDRRLYLPHDWAKDRARRKKCHVPKEIEFQESWRIGLDLLDRSRQDVPFAWVAGDDEYGRPSEFRAGLRARQLHYVLDVPCTTSVRPLENGETKWSSVEALTHAQPSSQWRKLKLGPGSKGEKVVRALRMRVQTRDCDGQPGTVEELVVIRTVSSEPRTWYTLARGPEGTTLEKYVQVHARRHGIEEMFESGKGEVGLADYEVRGWVGWHHHMTLSLLALWFLNGETERVGGKNPGTDIAADEGAVRPPADAPPGDITGNRRRDHHGVTTQRRSSDLCMARGAQDLPAATA
jgi:SRSO17 transposase